MDEQGSEIMGMTPMMQQYLLVKDKCKDCILFFRLGDFYEMFFDDAEVASKELELVLTGRDCGLDNKAPMCGIPHHAANSYIGRLISKGFKVAICEQLEDPATAIGIVKRDIIKIITPGTYTDSSFLEDSRNNYLMSLYIDKKDNMFGICFADISTGEFNGTSAIYDLNSILDEISKYAPKELICSNDLDENILKEINERFNLVFTKINDESFNDEARNNMDLQFPNLKDTVMDAPLVCAANGLLKYIFETQKLNLTNINKFEHYNIVDYLSIDINSRRNLELTETMKDKSKKGSLLWVLDKTSSSMGGRLLRKWIDQPLINKRKIDERLEAVEELVTRPLFINEIKGVLKSIYDIERISGKISSKSVNAREIISLKNSVSNLPKIKDILNQLNCVMFKRLHKELDTLTDVYELIDKSISDEPSITTKDGNLIKDGFNEEIDRLRSAKAHGKEWIASLEYSEREVTGIKSLKIGYNRVFGYYIEITKSNFDAIPEGRYIRKQTLSNAERYITEDLKVMEEKILGAEEKLINLEYEEFVKIREKIEKQIIRMKRSAEIIATTDCINSFSEVSLEYNYCRPKIKTQYDINIIEGRHSVIEKVLPIGTFVSNDIHINNQDDQLLLITGPNMAGKSTYMRQLALIVIMAQIGCFVPAKSAEISICDKIFTRIGASDDLASGKSTFMVEMWEVSNILKNATNRSLVLLDEVGRGTSTYDGLSIAWSVIEYLCNENFKCKTLFATHYHELTKLEGIVKGVKNYSVAVKKIKGEIVFIRKIVAGGADESYGIEVAKLAGLPNSVISRAKEILNGLENGEINKIFSKNEVALDYAYKDIQTLRVNEKGKRNKVKQLGFGDIEKDVLINELAKLDITNMTPLEGLNKLNELVKKATII